MTPARSFPVLAGRDSMNFMAKTSAVIQLRLHEHAEDIYIYIKNLSGFSIPRA